MELLSFEYLLTSTGKTKKTWDDFSAELVNVVRCLKCESILKEIYADSHVCATMKGGKNANYKN